MSLLVVVSRHLGLGTAGYGYLLAGFGAGGVSATLLAGRLARLRNTRMVVFCALLTVALPLPVVAAAGSPFVAAAFAMISGAGSVSVEILAETALQRYLPDDVFARAYGFALPASLAGIVVGGLIAPTLLTLSGVTGAFVIVAAAVVAYAVLFVVRPAKRQPSIAPANAVARFS